MSGVLMLHRRKSSLKKWRTAIVLCRPGYGQRCSRNVQKAVGDGIVDFKAIYELLGDDVIYIVEQEQIKTMKAWEAVAKSRNNPASACIC